LYTILCQFLSVSIFNFSTYEYLELVPGPYMNMIIGPNGSGKSTILCGLCLGLGGKTSSIGRVTKVGFQLYTSFISAYGYDTLLGRKYGFRT